MKNLTANWWCGHLLLLSDLFWLELVFHADKGIRIVQELNWWKIQSIIEPSNLKLNLFANVVIILHRQGWGKWWCRTYHSLLPKLQRNMPSYSVVIRCIRIIRVCSRHTPDYWSIYVVYTQMSFDRSLKAASHQIQKPALRAPNFQKLRYSAKFEREFPACLKTHFRLLEPRVGGWKLRIRIVICKIRDMGGTFSGRVMVSCFP